MKTLWRLIIITVLLFTANMAGCARPQRNLANGKIVFQSERDGNSDLYVMNPDGSEQRNLTNSPSSDSVVNNVDPSPSPDGRKIAFQSDRDGNNEIYVIDIESGVQLNLTKNHANDYSPTWSPDGKYIAFVSDRDSILLDAGRGIQTNNIYIMDAADGSEARRLTKENIADTYAGLSWSPDGRKLALCLSSSTQWGGYFSRGINVITLSNSRLTRLTFDQSTNQCNPKWSPDGKHLAYLVLGSMRSDIYVMNTDGTGQVALSKSPSTYDISPSWSPDGKSIVFSSRRSGSYHLYAMDPDGSNQVQLTNGPGEETFPAWLPAP